MKRVSVMCLWRQTPKTPRAVPTVVGATLLMFAGMIPPDKNTKILRRCMGLLPRLAPVVAAMNYFGYQAMVKECDYEAGYARTTKVTTYRLDEDSEKEGI